MRQFELITTYDQLCEKNPEIIDIYNVIISNFINSINTPTISETLTTIALIFRATNVITWLKTNGLFTLVLTDNVIKISSKRNDNITLFLL